MLPESFNTQGIERVLTDIVLAIKASTNSTPWIDVTFTNGWVNYGAPTPPVQYMKDAHGFVHLRGLMKNGTIGLSAFTLPVGYRNSYFQRINAISGGLFGAIDVPAAGTWVPAAGTSGSFSFDGVNFLADS